MKNIYSSLAVAQVAKLYPLNYFDVGSRGGFQDDLHPLAFAVHVVGFEPDPEEFQRLQNLPTGPWKSVKILPHGLSGQSGSQMLYIPIDPHSASLLKHDGAIGRKFQKPHFFELDRTEEIETLDLQDALENSGLSSVDYLKIDIEGAELAVFQSSPQVMDDVLAIKTEVSFIPVRTDQPQASDVDIHLRKAGFELMDIIEPAHWRRYGYLIHPWYSRQTPPYSKAQIIQADLLYFRNPDSLGGDTTRLMKLALIALSLGYFDHALMILERPEIANLLHTRFHTSPLQMVTPLSKKYGRKAFLKAFYNQFRNLIPFVRYVKNLVG